MLFEDIHKKLQRTLARKKQEMAEIIGVIADSHEAREKVRLPEPTAMYAYPVNNWYWEGVGLTRLLGKLFQTVLKLHDVAPLRKACGGQGLQHMHTWPLYMPTNFRPCCKYGLAAYMVGLPN
jgi:hypothetical protein